MIRYLLRRVLFLIPVWLGISFIAFALANLAPGDPAWLMLQRELNRPPTIEELTQAREEMGLDGPFVVRYVTWLGKAVTGDFGTSYASGGPVLEELASRFPNTLQLAVASLLIALAVAMPLGVLSAIKRNSLVDHLSRVGALLGAAMPSYWLAYLLILVFAIHLSLLPVAGRGTWQHLVLPAVTLALAATASLMRLTRAELLEVLGQDYVQTARAKGLSSQAVHLRHAFRNALLPVVTVAGMRFAGLLGGTVIVETIFAWPGVGKYIVDSIFNRDYPVIQGFVLFMGTVFILVNLIVDLSYAWLDPRIQLVRT
jgi:peptide/nickel transport system permease protein